MRRKVYVLYIRICSNDLYAYDCRHINTDVNIQGDSGGKITIFEDDWIGICEKKMFIYIHVFSANGYQDRSV